MQRSDFKSRMTKKIIIPYSRKIDYNITKLDKIREEVAKSSYIVINFIVLMLKNIYHMLTKFIFLLL